ncbi:MAG: RND family efflux transporter MFP subunit [Paraglaciecola sp.]|jgi:RND family efflux transporter MFP subunit
MKNSDSRNNPTKTTLMLFTVLLPFIALTILMSVSGAGQSIETPSIAKLHRVDVMPIELQQQYILQRIVVGKIEATQTADVGFDLSGIVVTTLVDEGDEVNEGQLIAVLDKQRLLAQMNELYATLARAQADARLAKLSEQRVSELVAKKLEPRQRLDEVREATASANALIAEVQARQQSLQVELQKTSLKAPFDGVIVARPVDAGTVVASGQAVYEIQLREKLKARIALSTDDAFSLIQGHSYPLSIGDKQIMGVLQSIAKQRRTDTHTIDAIFTLPADIRQLVSGDLISIQLSRSATARGAWVARQALSSSVRGLWNIFVVTEQQGLEKIQAKVVEVLHADEQKAYIAGAFNTDDLVVINGLQRLVSGQLVQANILDADKVVLLQDNL